MDMNYYKYMFALDSAGSPVQPVKPTTPSTVRPVKPSTETPNKPEGTGRYGLKHSDGSPCDAKTPESCPLNHQKQLPSWYDKNASAGVQKAYSEVLEKGYFVSTKPEAQQAWAKQLNGNVWGAKRQADGSVHFYPKGGEYEHSLLDSANKNNQHQTQNNNTVTELEKQMNDAVYRLHQFEASFGGAAPDAYIDGESGRMINPRYDEWNKLSENVQKATQAYFTAFNKQRFANEKQYQIRSDLFKDSKGNLTELGNSIMRASWRGTPGENGHRINSEDMDNAARTASAEFEKARQYGSDNLASHGIAKGIYGGTLRAATELLFTMVTNGLDKNHNNGQLYSAPLTTSSEEASGGSGSGTASGTSYRDGPMILVAKQNGQGFDMKMDNLGAVLINDAYSGAVESIRKELNKIRPDIIVEPYSNVVNAVRKLTGR